MRIATKGWPWFRLSGLAAVLVLGFAVPARAELDYEFGKALLDKDEPSFSTEDLIQRLIKNLAASPTASSKSEGMLLKATLMRREAQSASKEKRSSMLKEVEGLYKQILADKTFRLFSVAEKEIESLAPLKLKSERDAILELKDPTEKQKMCHELAEQLGKEAEKLKAEAEAAKPIFDAAYKKFTDWKAKNDPNDEGKPVPGELITNLDKTFWIWIEADRHYVASSIEQLEAYYESDPAKKTLSDTLAKYCETKAELEVLSENFPVIAAWYYYMAGRGFAAVQNSEKATEDWQKVIALEPTGLKEDQRKAMLELQKMILVDLVKMKMRAKKYDEVEYTIADNLIGHKEIFEDNAGKDLLVDYCKALTLKTETGPGDFEKALGKLHDLIAKEKNNAYWANRFALTMGEILDDARKKSYNLRLTAEEWFEAAHGYFQMGLNEYQKYLEAERDTPGKAKEQFDKVCQQNENAVNYYRHAIAAARSEKTELATRIDVEPKAWSEMGRSYIIMKQYYEAVAAYQAMRATFQPERRKLWMPDPAKKPYSKSLQNELAELDKDLLPKSARFIKVALEENKKVHKDLWNKKWYMEVQESLGSALPGEGNRGQEYQKAGLDLEDAKNLVDTAKSESNPKSKDDIYRKALAKYISAGEKFLKVPAQSEDFVPAVYQAGQAYAQGQGLLTEDKIVKPDMAQAKELSQKALDCFNKYLEAVKKTPPKDEDEGLQRTTVEGAVLLARNNIYTNLKDWEAAIKSGDEYIDWELHLPTPPAKSALDTVWLNKFLANVELTGTNFAPKCDPYLKAAETALNEVHKLKKNDNKLYVFMLNMLSRRFNMAAFQAEKFIKESKMPAGSEEPYELKVAELQEIRVDKAEEDPNQVPTLEDYSRLVYLFNKAQKYEKAVLQAHKLLEKFDPKNKNMCIPDDDPKVWQTLLARMIGDPTTTPPTPGVVFYDDLHKLDNCKKDHTTLIDYMYDTMEGLAAATPDKRPPYDKYNKDPDQALKWIGTIKKNYPNCQTLKATPKSTEALKAWADAFKEKFPDLKDLLATPEGEPKAMLTIVEDEIDFRRKIFAARDLLSEETLDVAALVEKEPGREDDAKKYRGWANEQLKILLESQGNTPEMQLKSAGLSITTGKYDEALDMLYKVKSSVDKDKPIYFDTSRKISEVYAKLKKWKEAAEYPQGIALIIGVNAPYVKTHWPSMRDFLKECYANGVPCPPQLKEAMEDKAEKAPAPAPDAEKKPETPPATEGKAAPEAKPAPEDSKKPAEEKKAEDKKPDAAK